VNWLLALALLASGATSWRERGEFGPGEVLYSVWLVLALFRIGRNWTPRCRDWLLFAGLGFLGLGLGAWLHPAPNLSLIQQIKPGLAWTFALVGAVLFGGRSDQCNLLGRAFAPLCLALMSFCWLAAASFPGARALFYFQDFRFSALSANPNQTAAFFLCLPWLVGQRWWLYPWILFLGLCTGSDSLLLAWSLGALWSVLERPASWRWLATLVVGCFLWTTLTTFQRPPADFVCRANAIENVATRSTLAWHGLLAWSVSPWVGWGPGAFSGEHFPFESFEAHNSWVDWATNAGLLGLLAYLQLVVRHGHGLSKQRRLAPFLALLVFSTFQYTFRQPIFWMSWWLCASEVDPRPEVAKAEK
jgi:hypothetical protein